MSKFRERTAAIVEQGEAERKSFEPKGAPARVYNYWLSHSDSPKAFAIRNGSRRENFCHWFWVVVFFAPMLSAGRFIDRNTWVLGIPIFGGALALVGVIIAEFGFLSFLMGVGVVLLVAAGLVGLFVAIDALSDKFPKAMTVLGLSLVGIAVAGVVGLLLWKFLTSTGLVGGSILALVLVVVAVVIWKFQSIASYIEGRAEISEQKAMERRLAARDEPVTVREPSRLDKFFKGFGEFVVMVAQFIRVKKWKTCPLIEVNAVPRDNEEDYVF